MKRVFIMFVLFVIVQTTSSYSDVLVEFKHTDKTNNTVVISTNSFKGLDMRKDYFGSNSKALTTVIYKIVEKLIININHKSRTYNVIDVQKMKTSEDKITEVIENMNKSLEDAPEEFRNQIQESMKRKLESMEKVDYVDPIIVESGRKMVNEYSCTIYEIYKRDEKIREYCVAEWSLILGNNEIKKSIEEVGKLIEEINMASSIGLGSIASDVHFENIVRKKISKLSGYPVLINEYSNGYLSSITTFKSSRVAKHKDAEFNIPMKYTKFNNPMY